MPRGTVNVKATERHDLKSLPDGYVVLRRMSYGQYLQRRDMAAHVRLLASQNNGANAFAGEIASANGAIAEFEFANCIVEHNIEDEHGDKLDFKRPFHVTQLDPRIGQEISDLISSMNNLEDDGLGNLTNGSEHSTSQRETPTLSETSS